MLNGMNTAASKMLMIIEDQKLIILKDVCIENLEQFQLLDCNVMSMLLINRWRSLELLR